MGSPDKTLTLRDPLAGSELQPADPTRPRYLVETGSPLDEIDRLENALDTAHERIRVLETAVEEASVHATHVRRALVDAVAQRNAQKAAA